MATDPVLEPFQLKGLRLKNRVMSTAHAPSYVEDGKPKLRYRLYHEEKAKGGLALTMFGGSTTTAPDSPSAFGQINASSDAIIPWFQELADAVHRHDCALMCQITHMGRRTCDDVADWLPTLAPSPVRERQHRSFPKDDRAARDQARARAATPPAARRAQGRRARRGRGDRLGPSGRPVPVAGHQPAHRRLWRQPREPLPLRARGVRAPSARRSAPDFVVGIRHDRRRARRPAGRDPDECVEIARLLARAAG